MPAPSVPTVAGKTALPWCVHWIHSHTLLCERVRSLHTCASCVKCFAPISPISLLVVSFHQSSEHVHTQNSPWCMQSPFTSAAHRIIACVDETALGKMRTPAERSRTQGRPATANICRNKAPEGGRGGNFTAGRQTWLVSGTK